MNCELPDVQAGFRKGRWTRDQIPNICWIIEKSREVQKKHLLLLYWLCQSLWLNAAAAAKSLQLCPTLCDHIDGSPPGSPVHGILQARTLEWVAVSFCNAWKWKVKVKLFSRVQLLATPWTAAHQAPPSIGFSRQECWSEVPLPSLVWLSGSQQTEENSSTDGTTRPPDLPPEKSVCRSGSNS